MSDNKTKTAKVAVIMGSKSDLPVMKAALQILEDFGVPYVAEVVSAHRTAEHMVDFATKAAEKGLKVIIAGAGGAAHLPGMVASLTPLPVIGVPVNSSNSIKGLDSLLSIVQMPGGVPVATVGIDNAKNAGLLAVRMLGLEHEIYQAEMQSYMKAQKDKVMGNREINKEDWG